MWSTAGMKKRSPDGLAKAQVYRPQGPLLPEALNEIPTKPNPTPIINLILWAVAIPCDIWRPALQGTSYRWYDMTTALHMYVKI